ncbi:hypothetical protein HDU80_008822 [Chytriomyces hyalinus]|nr:hypothetical protein HDU80_008822 [Chytriomyces hyalinus]
MDSFIDDSKEAQVLTVVIEKLDNLPEDEVHIAFCQQLPPHHPNATPFPKHNMHNTQDPNVNDQTKPYAGDVVSLVDPINEQQIEPPHRSSPVDTKQVVALSSVSQTSMVDAFINNDSTDFAILENELAIVKTPDEITEVDLQNAKETDKREQELTLNLLETNKKGNLKDL